MITKLCNELAIREFIDPNIYGCALTFFHYYTYLRSFREFDKLELAIACVYLAKKINYKFMKLEDTYAIYDKLFDKYCKNVKKRDIRKIDLIEMDLLNSLNYDVNFELPYLYVEYFAKKFNVDYITESNIYCIINESFRRPLCIYFHPRTICLAAFFICENFTFKKNNSTTSNGNGIYNSAAGNSNTNNNVNIIINGVPLCENQTAIGFNGNNNLKDITQNVNNLNPYGAGSFMLFNTISSFEVEKINNVENDYSSDGIWSNNAKNNNKVNSSIIKDKQYYLNGENEYIKNEFDICYHLIVNLITSKLKI